MFYGIFGKLHFKVNRELKLIGCEGPFDILSLHVTQTGVWQTTVVALQWVALVSTLATLTWFFIENQMPLFSLDAKFSCNDKWHGVMGSVSRECCQLFVSDGESTRSERTSLPSSVCYQTKNLSEESGRDFFLSPFH